MQKSDIKSDLKKVAHLLLKEDAFRCSIDRNVKKVIMEKALQMGVSVSEFFFNSLTQRNGSVYLVHKMDGKEVLSRLSIASSSQSGSVPHSLFLHAPSFSFSYRGAVITVYTISYNNENLRVFIEKVAPDLRPQDLKNTPRLGLGVRMLFTLHGLFQGLEEVDAIADHQLSAGREFSLREVIEAPPDRYPEWLGHTGLDAAELYGTIARQAFKSGVEVYGTEIDHLIITNRPEEAISRIRSGVSKSSSAEEASDVSERNLEESMKYNRLIIDEAVTTGFVRGITTDSSALLREEYDDVERWSGESLKRVFERNFNEDERKILIEVYKPGLIHIIDDEVSIVFSEDDIMRLALKFQRSLEKSKELYDYMKMKLNEMSFTFEPSLDEAYKSLTTPKELFFYLMECSRLGMPGDLIAPNVGFKKRTDYKGDLNELYQRVKVLSKIASHFNAILDFHSGSDKRGEVYQTISRACDGRLKIKMSGVYQLLYFDLLADFDDGSEERELFNRIFDYTLEYVRAKAAEGDPVAKSQLEDFEKKLAKIRSAGEVYVRDSREDFLRYYSFIVVGAKNRDGSFIFRDTLYRLAEKDKVKKRYIPKVVELTKSTARALGLQGIRSKILINQPKP